MTLLVPLGLAALLAIPVIVALHLLHERNRRLIIPSLELWAWLERQVRGPRVRRLPITWVLVLQVAAALLLALALAQPLLAGLTGPGAPQRLILILDTSTSMTAVDARPNRLAWAQARAGTALARLGTDDSAVVIAAGPITRLLGDSREIGLPALGGALAGLRAGGTGNDWATALSLASAAVLPDHRNRIVIYSDGAFELTPELTEANTGARIEWIRVGSAQSNQAVVALAARPSASGAVQVFARIANFGDRAADRTVTLRVDGEVLDSHRVVINAAGTLGQVWTLPPNVGAVEVALSGGDALPADDMAALGLQGSRPIEALLVSEDPAAVARALGALSNVRLATVAPADYVPFVERDLTVFHGWLPEAWPDGGVLVFDPPPGNSLLPVADFAPVGAVPGASLDPLLAEVDLSRLTFGRAARIVPPEWLTPALVDQYGTGLLWRGSTEASQVVAATFVLSETNMPRRTAFPVMVANAVAEVLPPPLPTSVGPAEAVTLPPARIFPVLVVTDPAGETVALEANDPRLYSETWQPGLYRLEGQYATGQAWRASFGVNGGALEESDLRNPVEPEFSGELGFGAARNLGGFNLWPLLAAAALLLVLAEARLAWR